MKKHFRQSAAFALVLLFAVIFLAHAMSVPVFAGDSYKVTITLGNGLTLESGTLEQEVAYGSEMVPCVIKADEGYGFPADYKPMGKLLGLKFEIDDDNGTITISGKQGATTAGDIALELPDAVPWYTVRFEFGEGLYRELDDGIKDYKPEEVKTNPGIEWVRKYFVSTGYYIPKDYHADKQYGFTVTVDEYSRVWVKGAFYPGDAQPGSVCVVKIPGAEKYASDAKIRLIIKPGLFIEGETVEQDVNPGEMMEPVTFTTSPGFQFPQNWVHDPAYGLSYDCGKTELTISGIPQPVEGELTITIQLPTGELKVEYGPTEQNVMWHAVDPLNVTATIVSSDDPTQYEVVKAEVTSVFFPPNSIQYTATAKDSNDNVYTNTWTVQIPLNEVYTPSSQFRIPAPINQGRPARDVKPPVNAAPEQPAPAAPSAPAAPAEPAKDETPALPFTDVTAANPYLRGITYVYQSGIMNGILPTEFNPYGTLTRAMFVTILGRLDGVDTALYTSSTFTDCDALGTWDYAPYVEWAAQKGIVLGYGDGTFGPMDPVTNEQAVLMLKRYAKTLGADGDTELPAPDYPEGTKISPWAADAVAWAFNNAVYPTETDAAPTMPAERGWMAQAIYNFVGYLIR